jgi:hypothetical protein
MILVFKSYKPKKNPTTPYKGVLLLNNYHRRTDKLDVVNIPLTFEHNAPIHASLNNHVGFWRIKSFKKQ